MGTTSFWTLPPPLTGGPTTSSHCGTSRRRRRGRRSDACGKDRSQIPQRLRCQTKRRQDIKNFGIYKNPLDKLYYIGNTPIDIRDDNLIVGDEEYEGTPGLWELIISKQPVDKTFGIYKNPLDKLYYIGNTPIDIPEDNLIVGHQEYEGTPGLWELISMKVKESAQRS